MKTQNFELLESVMNLAKERDFYKSKCDKLEAELEEFYRVREFMNSISSANYVNDVEDDIIPFDDIDDVIPFGDDIEVVEFEASIPANEDVENIEIPDFTEFLEDETEEEEIVINQNENGFDEDLFNEAVAEVTGEAINTEDNKIDEDIEESFEEAEIKEEKTASAMLKEIVQSKSTIEILDRKKKEFENYIEIEKYVQNVLDNYVPRKTEFGEDNPLLKDIKKVYSFISKALKRDSLKYIKDTLGIEEGFKISSRYRLSVMNALKDIKYILEYKDEPLSQKQCTFDLGDKEVQEIEDTEQKTVQTVSSTKSDLKSKIIDFYERESIKDTKEKDLEIFDEMTEEQMINRFITDINFQINALKQGWDLKHFKSAKEDFGDVIPTLLGDELKSKMNLDLDLLKLLNWFLKGW